MRKDRKRHYISWLRFWGPVVFGPQYDKRMESEEIHKWGWKTLCGEVFGPKYKGTTNEEDVTCRRCKKMLGEPSDSIP